MLDDELNGATAGVSSHIGTDNKATEGWYNRKASRASHKAPERFLRWLAMRQRWTLRGPERPKKATYYEGERDLLGDFPSRSYEEGFPRDENDAFLQAFSKRHPLPPKLGCWRLVHPRAEIVSAVCSLALLRGKIDTQIYPLVTMVLVCQRCWPAPSPHSTARNRPAPGMKQPVPGLCLRLAER
jgi:hypothetical protein